MFYLILCITRLEAHLGIPPLDIAEFRDKEVEFSRPGHASWEGGCCLGGCLGGIAPTTSRWFPTVGSILKHAPRDPGSPENGFMEPK